MNTWKHIYSTSTHKVSWRSEGDGTSVVRVLAEGKPPRESRAPFKDLAGWRFDPRGDAIYKGQCVFALYSPRAHAEMPDVNLRHRIKSGGVSIRLDGVFKINRLRLKEPLAGKTCVIRYAQQREWKEVPATIDGPDLLFDAIAAQDVMLFVSGAAKPVYPRDIKFIGYCE